MGGIPSDSTIIEIIRPKSKEVKPSDLVTKVSKNIPALPQAVQYANERNAVLWSMREAVASGIEINPKEHSHVVVATRTAAIYFRDVSGKYLVAFNDNPSPLENIVLSRAQEGYLAHIRDKKWLLSKDDKYVKSMLNESDRQVRIVEVDNPLELATRDGYELDMNRTGQALFGDLAGLCGAKLTKHGYHKINIYMPSVDLLKSREVDRYNVEIRFVGLSIDAIKHDYNVVANYPLFFGGIACGIRNPREFKRS